MPPHTLHAPPSAPSCAPRRPTSPRRSVVTWLHDTLRALLRSEREQYLSQSGSHAELEQRLRQWDDYCVQRSRNRSLW